MIRKSGYRFSEKIMLNEAKAKPFRFGGRSAEHLRSAGSA